MAASTDLIETIDPATGEVIAEVPYASVDDIGALYPGEPLNSFTIAPSAIFHTFTSPL